MKLTEILIVSDFDFTLTDASHQVNPANVQAIQAFIDDGGAFCVGTGRARDMFAPQADSVPINAPCVVSNGAALYDFAKEETLYMAVFSPEEQEKIPLLLPLLDANLKMEVESGYDKYLPEELWVKLGPDGWKPLWLKDLKEPPKNFPKPAPPKHLPLAEIPQPWIKLVCTGDQARVNALAECAAELGLHGVHSMPGMFEIQPAGVDKGSGARRLAELLHRKVLVCIGDAPNDTAMLQAADYAYVPESADAGMRAMGFRSCAHMDEGAVADVIRQLREMCDE